MKEESDELKFLRRLMDEADMQRDYPMHIVINIREMLSKRIQEVEMRDWNL